MNTLPIAVAVALGAGVPLACAQSGNLKPPQAQAWIDVATYSGMGMPGMGAPGMNPMQALGGLFGGGGAAKNSFGHTVDGATGRWVDVTLMTRANPSLTEATQAVPSGFMSPALKLQAPPSAKPAPRDDGDEVVEHDVERPRGRLLLYWGCGATVRAGQPKVLDMASASAGDIAKFFVSRRATQRGAHSASGRPVWPSPADARMLPEQASLVGEHAFSGAGVPEGFRFAIPSAQDLMPPLQLQQADQGGATELRWAALPTARAYFVAGMGAAKQDEMVIWTSSELPDTGFGLLDYQPNASIDRWVKEKVLLPAGATGCTVPKGVLPAEGGMLRAIAYGSELNLAHPPRPADPKAPWEPVWAAKLRVKSVASLMLGMPGGMSGMGQTAPAQEPGGQAGEEAKKEEKKPKPLDLLRGILGR
ncbi:MAG: hypothetical protein QM722_02680 [Piscinibacter sp.]